MRRSVNSIWDLDPIRCLTRSTSLSRDKYEEDEVKNEQNRMKKLKAALEILRLLGDRMISS